MQDKYTVVDYQQGQSEEEFGRAIHHALEQYLLVHAKGVPAEKLSHEFWVEVCRQVGEFQPLDEDPKTGKKNGGYWIDIRNSAERDYTYRHNTSRQPLHTDGAYTKDAWDIAALCCMGQAGEGGETIFCDGSDIYHWLQAEKPDLLQDILNTEITFFKADSVNKSTIIRQNQDDIAITWNYYRLNQDESKKIKDVSERFFHYLETDVVDRGRVMPIRLKTGEAAFFHDKRLLHGRYAFKPSSENERYLLKAALNLH